MPEESVINSDSDSSCIQHFWFIMSVPLYTNRCTSTHVWLPAHTRTRTHRDGCKHTLLLFRTQFLSCLLKFTAVRISVNVFIFQLRLTWKARCWLLMKNTRWGISQYLNYTEKVYFKDWLYYSMLHMLRLMPFNTFSLPFAGCYLRRYPEWIASKPAKVFGLQLLSWTWWW